MEVGKGKKDREKRRMMGLHKRLQRYLNLLNKGMDFSKEITEVKKKCQFYPASKVNRAR